MDSTSQISAYVVWILDRDAASRFREAGDLGNMARALLHERLNGSS
jgi:hypothetical protein